MMSCTQEVVFKQEKYTKVLGIDTIDKKRQIDILSKYFIKSFIIKNVHNERFLSRFRSKR